MAAQKPLKDVALWRFWEVEGRGISADGNRDQTLQRRLDHNFDSTNWGRMLDSERAVLGPRSMFEVWTGKVDCVGGDFALTKEWDSGEGKWPA